MTKTKAELDDLKAQWKADPCWDIANTEGFEEYKDELQEYQENMEAEYKSEELSRLLYKSINLGCSIRTIIFIEALEERIKKLEER